MKPSISVIIPIYNGSNYLATAINTVLQQTYPITEIILIDDGSTDNTAQIAHRFPVKYLYQSNQGSSAARNKGIKIATGEFIAFLDADDLWKANKLQLQLQLFEDNPHLDIVFSHIQQFISPDCPELATKVYCPKKPQPGYLPSTTLVRASVFEVVGLFNESLHKAEFIDWYNRALDCNFKMAVHPEVLAKRRLHRTNKGMQNKDMTGFLQVVKANLQRKTTRS